MARRPHSHQPSHPDPVDALRRRERVWGKPPAPADPREGSQGSRGRPDLKYCGTWPDDAGRPYQPKAWVGLVARDSVHAKY